LVLGIGIAQQFMSSIVLGIVLMCRTWYSPSLLNTNLSKLKKKMKIIFYIKLSNIYDNEFTHTNTILTKVVQNYIISTE
jgi:hypothetical protein